MPPQSGRDVPGPDLLLKGIMMVNTKFARSLAVGAAALGLLGGSSLSASAQQILNIYTSREPGLIKPLLDEFTK